MLILSIITFIASLTAVNLIRKYFHYYLIDIPNIRSSHKVPTPRGGGLGFIIAFALGLVIYHLSFPASSTSLPLTLWLSLVPLIIISLLDDWKSMRATLRYAIQFSVSTLIVLQTGPFPQPWVNHLGLFGQILSIVFTIIGITVFINFYNFMDGLDGLVAGVSLVQFSFFALLFHHPTLWLLVAALAGFLALNWSPAQIFMGDAGSTVLGAVIPIVLLQNSSGAAASWTYLAMTLPLMADALYTLIRRALRQENIFQAHRTHLYQRLNQSGWPHANVALLYIGATCAVGLSIFAFGAWGASLSLVGAIAAIIQVENYLVQISRAGASPTDPAAQRSFSALVE
jgi:Fuc2NAc and GlcNAc transferase